MTTAPLTPPPIPLHLASFPTVGGLVVPFITPRHHDGRAIFGSIHPLRVAQCLHEHRCSVCGGIMDDRMVFFRLSPALRF